MRPTITRREIDAAINHASSDATRANLCAVHVQCRDGWTQIESTDGRRALRIQRQEEATDKYDALLALPELKTASKLITGVAANPNTNQIEKLRSFALSEEDNRSEITAEVVSPLFGEDLNPEASAVLRTLPGEFPNVDSVIPHVGRDTERYVRVTVNPQYLIDAAKALQSLCTTNRMKAIELHVPFDSSRPMVLTGQHPVNGTRAAVVIMLIRAGSDILGDPFPKDEEERSAEK